MYQLCSMQLHPSPLSPPLHFTAFHPSIIHSHSFSLLLHPLHCPSHLLLLPLSCLSLLFFMMCFPLTFKPTFAFEHQPPSIFTSASFPIFSTYLEYVPACPSPRFSPSHLSFTIRAFLIFHFQMSHLTLNSISLSFAFCWMCSLSPLLCHILGGKVFGRSATSELPLLHSFSH